MTLPGLASVLWLVVGYSLAFGEGDAFIGDFSKVLIVGINRDTLTGDIPEGLFMLFQMTFAIITPALIIGGFAERMKFAAVLLFSGYGFADGISTMAEQVMVQLTGIGATFAYTAIVTYILLKFVGMMTGGLRVFEEQEEQGLDQVEHDESGYSL